MRKFKNLKLFLLVILLVATFKEIASLKKVDNINAQKFFLKNSVRSLAAQDVPISKVQEKWPRVDRAIWKAQIKTSEIDLTLQQKKIATDFDNDLNDIQNAIFRNNLEQQIPTFENAIKLASQGHKSTSTKAAVRSGGGIGKPGVIAAKTKSLNGKRVCAHSNDHPQKSKRNKKGHVDAECCLDPDETPNANCYYPQKKYTKMIQRYLKR